MKVVPSLGSVLPAPAARSTPATVADPDHLQLTPAVLSTAEGNPRRNAENPPPEMPRIKRKRQEEYKTPSE